ncbi:TolC family protein [Bacillus tuaregi]|uniref:TolC family protein n=1 Tax=Bacillus tuaregi TaxID=1816695 RepID=UPI0008F7EE4D|nr:TolC family protein [Bacillus tuaregi]
MKKFAYMLAAGLAFTSLQPTIYAQAAVNQQEETTEKETLSVLSIDDVIERGLDRNSTLLLLEYQMEIMDNQHKDMEKDIEDLEDDIDEADSSLPNINLKTIKENIAGLQLLISTLEEEIAGLEAELGEDEGGSIEFLENQNELLKLKLDKLEASIASGQLEQVVSGYNQALQAINAQIEALEDAIDQLQLALQKMEVGELQLNYEAEEAEQMVKMMLTSSYTGLISTKQQIDLMESSVVQVEKNVNILEKKVEVGIASAYELEQSERDLEKQRQALDLAKQDYQRELAKLLLDIDVEYNAEIKLKDLEINTNTDKVAANKMDKLVKDSYAYKKAELNLKNAELDLNDLMDQDDASEYKIKQAELTIEVDKEKIRQLKLDLKESIENLYYDLDKAVQTLSDKKRDLEYAKNDSNRFKVQYELGIISEFQYQQSSLSVKQAEFDLEMAEISYYMINEQVKATHEGVIQVQ